MGPQISALTDGFAARLAPKAKGTYREIKSVVTSPSGDSGEADVVLLPADGEPGPEPEALPALPPRPPAFDASASMFGEPEPEPERVPSPDSWMPGPGASAPQVMEAVDDDVEDLQPEPQPEAAAGGQTEVPAVRVDL